MSKTIIIGGVAVGATVAARLRRMDENMDGKIQASYGLHFCAQKRKFSGNEKTDL